MNINAIYNRLQYDTSSILGFMPQLDVARAPLYEECWRDMLVLIEQLSHFDFVVFTVGVDGDALCYDDLYLNVIPSGVTSISVIVSGILPASTLSTQLVVPAELVALVLQFLCTRKASTLRTLRQICLFTYKVKSHEVTKEAELTATEGFISRNATCSSLSYHYYAQKASIVDDRSRVLKLARLLAGMVFDRADFRNIRPSHGPGAVSDAKRGYNKWSKLDSRTTRLCDKYYPMSDWNVPTPAWFEHLAASYAHSVCKLAIVPKDKRGPRVICTQPVGLMWIQQGQLRSLNKAIESSAILKTNRLINGELSSSIYFNDQSRNGSLALESSRTREFATIDLKDASDLISWGLVRYLLNKENTKFLAASRAMYVRLQDKELVKLHMFAPMGSAMCFPVESLVFWCVAAAATYVQRGVTYEYLGSGSATKFLRSNPTEVFVFGDDVLVRRESCKFVCECFEWLGFVPNRNKTFSEGFYRESCGVDAYLGERLDIARLQCLTLTSMSEAFATIDLSNRSRALGLSSLADYLECQVEAYLGFKLAAGLSGSNLWLRGWPCNEQGADIALSWNLRRRKKIRFNPNLQYWEAMSVIARPLDYIEPQDGRYRLFRGLTSGVDEHTVDWLKPDNTQYHLGWVRAF
jgi:hypothetical protein